MSEAVFYRERDLRPGLRALIHDQHAGDLAREFLLIIAVPEDIRFLLQSAAPQSHGAGARNWATELTSAMLDPSTEAEWDFLRKCAFGEAAQAGATFGAIAAMRLNGTARAVQILKEIPESKEATFQSRAEAAREALKKLHAQ